MPPLKFDIEATVEEIAGTGRHSAFDAVLEDKDDDSICQPQRDGTRQPRAPLWVRRTMESPALKGRDNGCAALSRLDREGTHTQGVALGWRVPRRWR